MLGGAAEAAAERKIAKYTELSRPYMSVPIIKPFDLSILKD